MKWDKLDIFRFRQRMGMTQTEFAAYVETRQATVSEWENGKAKPGRMARRLLTVLAEKEAKEEVPA